MLTTLVMLCVLLPAGPAVAAPPPANDDFASATTMTQWYSTSQSTAGATVEVSEPQPCGSGLGATVWFKYLSPGTGWVVADTFGSDFDTVLAVYTGAALDSLVNITCNDDASGSQSEVVVSLTGGVTYWFQVGGNSGATGNLEFRAEPPTCLGYWATHVGTPGPDIINGTSGLDVIVGLSGERFGMDDAVGVTTPEPETAALLTAGLSMLAALGRRRR